MESLQDLYLACSRWEWSPTGDVAQFISDTNSNQHHPQSLRFNTKGALWGSIVSIVVVSFIAIGAQINIFAGKLRYETLPFNIEQCDAPTRLNNLS